MTQTAPAEVRPLEVLRHVLQAATHEASAAMCRWTGGLISLTLDEVCEVPLEEATTAINVGAELLTMVVLSLPGEVGGDMILTFDDTSGHQLAAMLLRRQVDPATPWSAMETSALCETGNILGCAYLNALTRLIGVELVPSAPYFLRDYGASVVQQAVLAQAATSDAVLICRTRFHCDCSDMNWNVLFIPTQAMRSAMERSVHR